ncbi:peptidase M14 [Rheinheimera sp. D18]|uniref:M14 family metallopeptidase n=1 Tax=Rheinheimera sp. D18 TaxID=2545632 RepID=UPI00104616F7|nr:M14 family metallopeptidase [Rheinheimera sp. D18]QBL08736.1 peptidase M14 [Rheinheimera sp. D18]
MAFKYKPIVCSFVVSALFAFSPSLFATTVVTDKNINADNTATMWPGSQYNAAIPTFKSVLGYDVGERITSHSDMLRYFDALQQAEPQRIKVVEYGRTWEGRKLIYAAIGNAKHIADLDGFAKNMQQLSDPRKTNKNTAKELIGQLPSSVWLEYSVHGNEISSTDAAMMMAYHLLAAPNEATNQKILNNTIVFIDPLQNPDGRSRFISRYYATVGLQHSGDRLSAEHNEPWPNGRSNHYLFDMNRDWLAITQPETAGRIKAMNHYRPLVVIDLHEMGGDQSYYFSPSAQPFNPHMTKTQINNMNTIGKNNGKHFDRFGFDFFTREVFDAFYPGYGDSWPTFYGASASTYEVSSSRGELFKKHSGENLTYLNTVQRHFVASVSTAEAVADNHEKLLNDYYQYQVTAIEAGKNNKNGRVFIIPNERNKAGSHRLATLMAQHDVDVFKATEAFSSCGKQYQAGAYFIDTAQPKGRFVTTTFSKQVDMDSQFIKEQERRRSRKLHDEIYDITGWSLPLMFDVDVEQCAKPVTVASEVVNSDDKLLGNVSNIDATVGFIVPWGDMAAGRFLTAALLQNIVIKSADKAFVLDDKQQFAAGSLIIEKRSNDADLAAKIAKIAEQTGAQVVGVNTSWVTEGPSFGSDNTVNMIAPNIAMAWDEPTSSLSAGNSRFVIERQFNYPVTAIRTAMLKSADLANYQVLILPSGDYKAVLGERGAANIKQWVERGGVLITLGDATKFAAEPEVGLLDVKRERAFKNTAATDTQAAKHADDEAMVDGQLITSKDSLIKASENLQESPDFVAGVLANIEVDQEHWLTAGVHKNLVAIAYGNDIYTPIKLASGKNVAWFAGADNVLASGYLWQENKQQLAYKPYLIHQPMAKGMVIGFTQEPTARAYLDGLNVMLLNTIFRASAHASPLR